MVLAFAVGYKINNIEFEQVHLISDTDKIVIPYR